MHQVPMMLLRFFKSAMPLIYSKRFYELNTKWLSKREEVFHKLLSQEWYEGFIRLVRSAESYDIRDQVKEISCPTMVVSASNDLLTPPECQKFIASQIYGAQYITLEDCGHAAMYEVPNAFVASLIGFVRTYKADVRVL